MEFVPVERLYLLCSSDNEKYHATWTAFPHDLFHPALEIAQEVVNGLYHSLRHFFLRDYVPLLQSPL